MDETGVGDRGQELSELWHALIHACRKSDPAKNVDTGALLARVARDHPPARSVLETASIDTQRRLIANLTSVDTTELDDDDLRALEQALAADREHPDEYVRHRVAISDGNDMLFRPLPPREGP